MDNSTGIYQIFTVPILFSDVNEVGENRSESGIPRVRNFPNPFSESTTVEYRVTKPGRVQLTVYDLFGRELMKFVDDMKTPGRYTVQFNPGSNAEYLNSGGIFLYRMKLNDRVESGKMVMIR
jgi:hypothetical protein